MVQLAILSRIAERRQQANVRHRFSACKRSAGFLLCRITQRAMLALVGLVALAPLCLLDEHATLLSEAQAEVARGGHVSSDTVASLRDAVAEDPQSVDLLTALGYALLPTEPEEALKPLRKCLRLINSKKSEDTTTPVTVQRTVVETLMRLQRFVDAAHVYSMYGHDLPAKTHQALALKLTQTSETASAVKAAQKHSEKAVELAPTEPTSHLARGLSLVIGEDSSRRDEATVSLQAAFKIRSGMRSGKVMGVKDSTYPDEWPVELESYARHTLGMLLVSEEEPKLREAEEQFAVAASLAPDQEQFQQSLQGVRHAMSEQGGAAGKGEL